MSLGALGGGRAEPIDKTLATRTEGNAKIAGQGGGFGSCAHHDDDTTIPPSPNPPPPSAYPNMSLRERVPPQYQNGEPARRALDDDSDVEEEAMANDYREQVQYDNMEDLDRMLSMTGNHDIHAQLQAAATPLEFQIGRAHV